MSVDLSPVERAAAKLAAARVELDAAMVAASAAGATLRPIAKAAGLSPEMVRQRVATDTRLKPKGAA